MYEIKSIKNIISVVTCPDLQFPENGYIYYQQFYIINKGYPVDTFADFYCNYGYTRNGFYSRYCQPSGNWDRESPVCDLGNNITFFHINFVIFRPYSTCLKWYFYTIL